MIEWLDGWIVGWIDGWMDGCMDGQPVLFGVLSMLGLFFSRLRLSWVVEES